jgi:hypothetical protein
VLTDGVNVIENAHGVDIEYIDTEQTANGSPFVQRVLVFQTNNRFIMIAFTTLSQFSKELFPAADVIGGSIELLQ